MRITICFIFLLGFVTTSHGESIDVVADLPFPKGISFGMSISELENIRPSIVYDRNAKILGKYEVAEVDNLAASGRCGYIYHFKDGKLGAVSYGRETPNMLADAETKGWYKNLVKSGGESVSMQTALGGKVFNVKKWSLQDPMMNVYFFATSNSTGITFISPDYFSFEDFFPNASEAVRQSENRKKLNAVAGRRGSKPTLIDRLSTNAPPEAALVGE